MFYASSVAKGCICEYEFIRSGTDTRETSSYVIKQCLGMKTVFLKESEQSKNYIGAIKMN